MRQLIIEGSVEGHIALKEHLTIKETGHITADIEVESLLVHGSVSGNIEAATSSASPPKPPSSPTSRPPGVVIEDGARFKGRIEMDVKLPAGSDLVVVVATNPHRQFNHFVISESELIMANTVIGNTIVIDGEITGTKTSRSAHGEGQDQPLAQPLRRKQRRRRSRHRNQTRRRSAANVTGNITSTEKVELKADGRMVGDIKAPRILIADGAVFKGNVDMER